MIINAIEKLGEANIEQLTKVLEGAFPGYLDDYSKKAKRVSNVLQTLKKSNIVDVIRSGRNVRWYIKKTDSKKA